MCLHVNHLISLPQWPREKYIGQVLTSPLFQSKNRLRAREGPQSPATPGQRTVPLWVFHIIATWTQNHFFIDFIHFTYSPPIPKNIEVSYFSFLEEIRKIDFPTWIQWNAAKLDYHTMPLWGCRPRNLPKVNGFISKWLRNRERERAQIIPKWSV